MGGGLYDVERFTMTEIVRKLKKSENLREELITFKNSYKNGEFSLTDDDVKYIITLLKLSDPKSRKNAAQILGISGNSAACDALISAYENEETEYVKAAYLLALKEIGCEKQRDRLESLRSALTEKEVTEENRKHIDEQAQAFNELLGMIIGKHIFTGNDVPSEVLLITQRGLSQVTAECLNLPGVRILGIGVALKTDNISEVLKARTFKEILFPIPELKKVPDDPYKAAEMLAESSLKDFLDARHDNRLPWGYRLSIVSKMDDKRRAMFIKRFAGELQRHSKGNFVNTASDYELEIRLLESKDGDFTPLIKLFTIDDTRFSYRREVVAASIRPELAANLAKLSEDYLRTDAQVLDPFCGVGTMLIERYKFKEAHPLYGIEIYGEAIEKAKSNAEAAGVLINFVHRDYFEFEHNYKFDEIFTNMPFSTRPEDEQAIEEIYRKFFAYSKELLKKDAYVIVYVRNIEAARKYSVMNSFMLEKEMLISDKEDSYLCIYRNIE